MQRLFSSCFKGVHQDVKVRSNDSQPLCADEVPIQGGPPCVCGTGPLHPGEKAVSATPGQCNNTVNFGGSLTHESPTVPNTPTKTSTQARSHQQLQEASAGGSKIIHTAKLLVSENFLQAPEWLALGFNVGPVEGLRCRRRDGMMATIRLQWDLRTPLSRPV